jgi:hypothetical protein
MNRPPRIVLTVPDEGLSGGNVYGSYDLPSCIKNLQALHFCADDVERNASGVLGNGNALEGGIAGKGYILENGLTVWEFYEEITKQPGRFFPSTGPFYI